MSSESSTSFSSKKAPEQDDDDNTSWKPSTIALSSQFLKKWPGVLGSTKWRTPQYIIDRIGGGGEEEDSFVHDKKT